jgi:uncharacterized repeat protein (TIGR03803 family)
MFSNTAASLLALMAAAAPAAARSTFRLRVLVTACAFLPGIAAAGQFSAIYTFTGAADGGCPHGQLLRLASGNLIATAQCGGNNYGAVVMLLPPATVGGSWTNQVLTTFTFGAAGVIPQPSVVSDGKTGVYGTTYTGSANGVGALYHLAPKKPIVAGAPWVLTLIWSFGAAGDGTYPNGQLVRDKTGKLYGTTAGGGSNGQGTVFQVIPATATTAVQENILWNFTGGVDGGVPEAGLTPDGAGGFYGRNADGANFQRGIVFHLTPPATGQLAWKLVPIHEFDITNSEGGSPAPLLLSGKTLYGTTYAAGTDDQGTVFQLTPPTGEGSLWPVKVIWNFTSGADGRAPYGGVVKVGTTLFAAPAYGGGGTLSGNGALVGLQKTTGQKTWSATSIYGFSGPDGASPEGALTAAPGGILYGTTDSGASGWGEIFLYEP